jgi:hypothetical protein
VSSETFLSYRSCRWMIITFLSLIGLSVWYLLDAPFGGRNGGTVYGYTVGILCALLIVYLMWFGVRKRSYYAARTTLQGWLSAHVWIGFGLTLGVLLHSGFQLGWNVHSAAYLLMVATIVSGIWGVFNYRVMPFQTPSNRGGASLSGLIDRVEQISSELDEAKRGGSTAIEKLVKKLNTERIPTPFGALIFTHAEVVLDPRLAAEALRDVPEVDLELGHRLIQLIDSRYELLHQIRREVRAQALLRLWLYLHIPLAFGTVTALIIHIFVVFYYHEPRLEDLSIGRYGLFSE